MARSRANRSRRFGLTRWRRTPGRSRTSRTGTLRRARVAVMVGSFRSGAGRVPAPLGTRPPGTAGRRPGSAGSGATVAGVLWGLRVQPCAVEHLVVDAQLRGGLAERQLPGVGVGRDAVLLHEVVDAVCVALHVGRLDVRQPL